MQHRDLDVALEDRHLEGQAARPVRTRDRRRPGRRQAVRVDVPARGRDQLAPGIDEDEVREPVRRDARAQHGLDVGDLVVADQRRERCLEEGLVGLGAREQLVVERVLDMPDLEGGEQRHGRQQQAGADGEELGAEREAAHRAATRARPARRRAAPAFASLRRGPGPGACGARWHLMAGACLPKP